MQHIRRHAVYMKPNLRSYAVFTLQVTLYGLGFRNKNHRPMAVSVAAKPSNIGDPEGGAQDAHRFSMRQDASPKNPNYAADGRFALDLSVFFGDFLDSRLRHSPFGPASPFAPQAIQCAKESYPRKARKPCRWLPITIVTLSHSHELHLTDSA